MMPTKFDFYQALLNSLSLETALSVIRSDYHHELREAHELMNRANKPTLSHEEWKQRNKQNMVPQKEDTILYQSPPRQPDVVAPGYNVVEPMSVEHAKQLKAEAGFVVKDSGKRAQFASGMVRDTTEGKVDVELIFNGPMADRWATHLTKGAMKYPDPKPGVPNWMLAEGEAELIRARKSAVRHFRQWLRGDVDEDHAAATLFNINLFEYVKAKMGGKS